MIVNSLAKLSERLQKSPASIEIVAEALKIEPALVIDGRRYFDLQAEKQIADNLMEAEIEAIRRRAGKGTP